jgi:hypothetical protein
MTYVSQPARLAFCEGVLLLRRIESTTRILPAAAMVLSAVVLAVAGCSGEPYAYTQVSGRVTYEDGSVIQAPRVKVTFVPQVPPVDGKTMPRPGVAEVDPATGKFETVTSHIYGDGIVCGEHKVKVEALSADNVRLPLVPPDYADVDKTPLHVNTKDSPFEIRVPKPNAR